MTAELLLMLNAILRGIRFVILVLSGYHHVVLENAALRQQLAAFKRDLKRPRLRRRDRLFWAGLRTDLEELEISSGDRSTGNSDFMAAQTIQAILVEVVAVETARAPANEIGDS
jgi:hypothetical protein